MPHKLRTILIEIISALLILLFTYTAISKISTHDSFRFLLQRSPLLFRLSNVIAWGVPAVEIMISTLLLIPKFKKIGLLFSTLVMGAFTIYIGYMIMFTRTLMCSCGGVLKELNWQEHLAFNIFFTILAFAGWRLAGANKDFIAINRISRTPV